MWHLQMRAATRELTSKMTRLANVVGLGGRLMPGTHAQPTALAAAFEGNALTSDRDVFAWCVAQVTAHPELGLGGPSMQWTYAALEEMARLYIAPLPKLPILVFLGSAEQVVSTSVIRSQVAKMATGELVELDGARHEILMETPAIQRPGLARRRPLPRPPARERRRRPLLTLPDESPDRKSGGRGAPARPSVRNPGRDTSGPSGWPSRRRPRHGLRLPGRAHGPVAATCGRSVRRRTPPHADTPPTACACRSRSSRSRAPAPWGLISGYRRLAAFCALRALDARYATIPAFVRQPDTLTDAIVAMVEENAIRAEVSPWEQAMVAVSAWRREVFPSLDAAIGTLYASFSRQRQHRLRAVALVAEELDGHLAAPETLSLRQLLRIAAALTRNYGDLMRHALAETSTREPDAQWRLLQSILVESETTEPVAPAPATGPASRPRRTWAAPLRSLRLRRELTPDMPPGTSQRLLETTVARRYQACGYYRCRANFAPWSDCTSPPSPPIAHRSPMPSFCSYVGPTRQRRSLVISFKNLRRSGTVIPPPTLHAGSIGR